jgi:hypothetical protein
MIRVEAIAATLPFGSMNFENKTDENGQRLIWLDHAVVARLRAMRGPGESYSDVILRLSADAQGCIVPRADRLREPTRRVGSHLRPASAASQSGARDRCDYDHADRRRMDERR